MSPDEAARTVAALRTEMLQQYRAHPIIRIATKAAADLNDILNAIALRLALLRWQSAGSRGNTDIGRLAELVGQATGLVRRLQECTHAAELDAPESAQPVPGEKNMLCAENPDGDLKALLDELSEVPTHVLVINGRADGDSAIKAGLERGGCRVTLAASAEDGLRILMSGSRFDNVVCDTSLLETSGPGFAAAVAQMAPTVRFYFMTRRAGLDGQIYSMT